MRVNFIGSSHIYYHKSNYLSLTTILTHRVFSKNPTKLDEWINAAQKYDIPELQTFINGIKKDITAVKNGIIYSYNNGLAEGSVNKIKVIRKHLLIRMYIAD